MNLSLHRYQWPNERWLESPTKETKKSLSEDSSKGDDPMPLESHGASEKFSDLEDDSSSVFVPTERNKKSIDKHDCNVGNVVLVLFNVSLKPGRITLISKEGCIVDCMEK